MRFLLGVNEGVGLQMTIPTKCLVARWTDELLYSAVVILLVKGIVTSTSKCLGAQVTRNFFWHFQALPPILSVSANWKRSS